MGDEGNEEALTELIRAFLLIICKSKMVYFYGENSNCAIELKKCF